MCTAISFQGKDHYFGRNLDLEYHYQEVVTIFPRNKPLKLRYLTAMKKHFAMIGMATVDDQYPLFYEATNEHGLSMAALSYPHNAVYRPVDSKKRNVAPFELIPWVLGRCKNVTEAVDLLKRTNLVNVAYSSSYPITPLHWLLDDEQGSVAVEPGPSGIELHSNPFGVLTNSPNFNYHLFNLQNYLHLTNKAPSNSFCTQLAIGPYSHGLGSFGLPGDLSSASRLVRAVFTKQMSICEQTEESCISQFFHILDSVAQTNGCVMIGDACEKTIYSCCCNAKTGIYYYTTYGNRQITAVRLNAESIDSGKLVTFPLLTQQHIHFCN